LYINFLFRVYSVIVKTGSSIYNVTKDISQRLCGNLKMYAIHRQYIGAIFDGDIATAVDF
jgi:elongation factor G